MYTILFSQLLKMLVYIAVGYFLAKIGLISAKNGAALSTLLLYVVLPCVILRPYLNIERSRSGEVLLSLGMGVVLLALATGVALLLYRKWPVGNFSAAYSNAGFFGLPLIGGILGSDAVMYIAGFVAVLNILQWTYGQVILSHGQMEVTGKELLKNPLLIAVCLGLIAFFVQLRLPQVVMDCIEGFAACNAPLAMVVLGISMASAPLGEMFRQIKFYGVSGVRLLLIPGLSILVLSLVPHAYNTMKLALLLAAAAPVGSNVVIYAQKWGADGEAGGQIVCLSTLLSMVTLPVVFLLASKIWGIG